jgi:hypothetical protein
MFRMASGIDPAMNRDSAGKAHSEEGCREPLEDSDTDLFFTDY